MLESCVGHRGGKEQPKQLTIQVYPISARPTVFVSAESQKRLRLGVLAAQVQIHKQKKVWGDDRAGGFDALIKPLVFGGCTCRNLKREIGKASYDD